MALGKGLLPNAVQRYEKASTIQNKFVFIFIVERKSSSTTGPPPASEHLLGRKKVRQKVKSAPRLQSRVGAKASNKI
jgi:hypothetical protein